MPASRPLEVADLTAAGRRARRLAHEVHEGQHDRYGGRVVDHVERVAMQVPPAARAVALVHDVCERSDHAPSDVAARLGLSADELVALRLLTREDGESLIDHVQRLLGCPDPAARSLALAVKRADVGDHLNRASADDHPYEQAATLLADASE